MYLVESNFVSIISHDNGLVELKVRRSSTGVTYDGGYDITTHIPFKEFLGLCVALENKLPIPGKVGDCTVTLSASGNVVILQKISCSNDVDSKLYISTDCLRHALWKLMES